MNLPFAEKIAALCASGSLIVSGCNGVYEQSNPVIDNPLPSATVVTRAGYQPTEPNIIYMKNPCEGQRTPVRGRLSSIVTSPEVTANFRVVIPGQTIFTVTTDGNNVAVKLNNLLYLHSSGKDAGVGFSHSGVDFALVNPKRISPLEISIDIISACIMPEFQNRM